MIVVSTHPNEPEPGSCGCPTFLLISLMIVFGILGFRFGIRFGVLQALAGAVIGVLASGPVTGVMVAGIAGIACLLGREK